ncbi:class I SAM-dependent methyltransferase [Siculibacillus lacustris]|uniref:class I SAM-dependent methyltransferase n=1 Tax=Siculibacillus lacustris TaxID=1549641 RepID=UPI0019CF8850|nr:class I SAM-dependent methyltransferase [Siculibacillus lacustris]
MFDASRLVRAAGIASVVALLVAGTHARADDVPDAKLKQSVEGPQRTPAAAARDNFRHPYEVLHFFGLRDDQTVVEIWPGGSGYWTEILAPYLRDKGHYYAAVGETVGASEETLKSNAAFAAKLAATPGLYDRVTTTEFGADRHEIAPAATADLVVTFRNVHNWMAQHEDEAAFRTFFRALKPGGTLGVEEHRGRTDQPQDPEAKSGYVRQDWTIALAERVGFEFAGSSEVNANPKDTKDYSAGVWTLPPVFRLGAVDRAKYEAIGESDRFVLKFRKPVQ